MSLRRGVGHRVCNRRNLSLAATALGSSLPIPVYLLDLSGTDRAVIEVDGTREPIPLLAAVPANVDPSNNRIVASWIIVEADILEDHVISAEAVRHSACDRLLAALHGLLRSPTSWAPLVGPVASVAPLVRPV